MHKSDRASFGGGTAMLELATRRHGASCSQFRRRLEFAGDGPECLSGRQRYGGPRSRRACEARALVRGAWAEGRASKEPGCHSLRRLTRNRGARGGEESRGGACAQDTETIENLLADKLHSSATLRELESSRERSQAIVKRTLWRSTRILKSLIPIIVTSLSWPASSISCGEKGSHEFRLVL